MYNKEFPNRKIEFGIAKKLTILIISIAVIPMFLLGFSNYLHNVKTLRGDSEKLLTQTANGMAGQTNEWIDKNLRSLILVSKQQAILAMNKEAQEQVLKSYQDEYPWAYLVFTIERNGMSLSRTDNGNRQDYSDRKYFKEIMAGKEFAFETLIGKTSKKPALVMAVPIKRGQETVGVLGAAMNIDTLSNIIATWRNGLTGFAFMVDEVNKVVSHPKPDFNQEQKNLSGDALVKSARSGQIGIPVHFLNESGKRSIGVAVKVSNEWLLAVRQDESEIFSGIMRFQIISIMILGITTLLAIIMALIAGRSISRPILLISDAANRMSLGDMDVNIEFDSRDEIGELASSISRLQTSLKIAMQRLKK